MRIFFLPLLTAVLLAGCATEKIPVEDPKALEVCAAQIKVLRDPYLAANSEEKHLAAKSLAEHLDFSFIRNVQTLDKIFLAKDAHISATRREVVFSYPYRDKDIQFRFVCAENTVLYADIVEK